MKRLYHNNTPTEKTEIVAKRFKRKHKESNLWLQVVLLITKAQKEEEYTQS